VRETERSKRPSVKRVLACDEIGFPCATARKFHGSLNSFSARVTEEDAVESGQMDKFLCEFYLRLGVVEVRGVHKRPCLRPDRFNNFRVAVPADVHSDSCDAVDVLVAFRVPDPGTAAAG